MASSVIVRQEMDKRGDRYKCFPPFLWLLRDMLVSMPERYSTPTEYLKAEVLGGDHSDSVKVIVRKSLNQCFPSFECRILPPPSTDPTVMANVSTSPEKLDSSFKQKVNELIAFIKVNIKAKKIFDEAGTECNGPTFSLLVKEIIVAANSPHSIPDVGNVWKMVVASSCKKVQERLLLEYTETMKERYDDTSNGAPLEEVSGEKSLMKIHDTLWSEVKQKLHNELGPLLTLNVTDDYTVESVTDQLKKQLIQTQSEAGSCEIVVGGALFPFIEENRKRSLKYCDKLFSKLYAPIKEKVQRTGEDEYTPEQLDADIKSLFEEYCVKAIGPEKGSVQVQMEATIDQNKVLFEKYLNEVSQHTKRERELQNDLRRATESKVQIDEKFDDLKKQLKEAEERRQEEIKELKDKVEEQREREKEMNKEEMKRRVEEAQRLAEESFKRESAEKELKVMEETLTKSKEEAAIRIKKAEEEVRKRQQIITENKFVETKRKEKAEKEIEDLEAQIREWQEKLEQKKKDHEKEIGEVIAKRNEMEQDLTDHKRKAAEEKDKLESKLQEKEEQLHRQQLLMNKVKADYEVMVSNIHEEKGRERELKEIAEEERKVTLERLDQAIENGRAEAHRLERELEEQSVQNEEEMAVLSNKIRKLKDDIAEYENKSWIVRLFTNPQILTE